MVAASHHQRREVDTRIGDLAGGTSTGAVADTLPLPPRPDAEPRPPRLAIIATKGSLDWAYPPLMLAVQAANKGWDVGVFFTFYGLRILDKRGNWRLKVAPVGNPAMPTPLPMPTLLATHMMLRHLRKQNVPSIEALL